MEFKPFPKMPRLNRDIVITEKLDGTNAQIFIGPANEISCEGLTFDDPAAIFQTKYALGFKDGLAIYAGSRTRWITPESDNFGFARWCKENAEELFKLGPGTHFGEWWGKGIQRGYGLDERRFSLFNTNRWLDANYPEIKLCPSCCDVVPLLYAGPFDPKQPKDWIDLLNKHGSAAVEGYMNPEGIIVYHTAANLGFKVTCKDDEKPKSA